MIKAQFEHAVEESKQLSMKPSNDTLLKLYSLYKQSTVGDAPAENPADQFDFVAKAKFTAWEELRGMSHDEAMQQYVELIEKLKVN
ncbi:MAG: acyl-CoA-binding protein [Chitinophagaceae bacterium]|nr:acyl-CoA-binding protein [Chitinophagaceae bacterium]